LPVFGRVWGPAAAAARAALLASFVTMIDGWALPLERRGGNWRFGDARLAIEIDSATGAFTRILLDRGPVARDMGGTQYFDIRTASRWLTGSGVKPRLRQVRPLGDSELTAGVRAGVWDIEFHYLLDPRRARIRRWVRIVWNGPAGRREKLRGFWLRTPQIQVTSDSCYFFPAQWPPRVRRAAEFIEGRKTSASRSPGALVAQISRNLSAVWLSDELTSRSDRPSVSVTEARGGFRVGQGYQSEGWVRPGRPQDIGDAWIWLLRCSGEQALGRIHDLLRDLGHVPPPDRSAWFQRAVLYSFHPGGTIGSQFRDLGGFEPATALLDAVRNLGCNSVWVLPIEDSGVYHPRDYYKLQKGLGSMADYRALVEKAHRLGMHVLQDIVPHGGTNDCPRARQHPEWLAQKEDGSTLSYWCFDFNRPAWQRYMAGVARYYMRSAGIDGFRVDAVYGSKIANWDPEIPYARASFARLQGGLHMLGAIRAAVKSVKSDAGLLAEVGNSAHGSVSDAVYDFTLCYTVLHDLRRRSSAVAVPDLERWLHEQDRAQAPGLIRLRHIESHDSLRSLLWYGVGPQRALMAFAAWIRGMPLVYHEMANGSSAVFRRIFRIRNALPELNGGTMNTTAVRAPKGVFTCLRRTAQTASVVAVNLNPKPAEGVAVIAWDALPAGLRSRPVRVLDAWRNLPVDPLQRTSPRELQLPVSLPPFGFTVLALRRDSPPSVPLEPDRWASRPATPSLSAPPENAVALSGTAWRLWVDRTTGLPARLDRNATAVLGRADLVLDPAVRAAAGSCGLRTGERELRAERGFGKRRLTITYRAAAAGPEIRARWTGVDPAPSYAALYWPVFKARRWYAACAEGVFEDAYRVRHLATDGVIGSIYWRPQGTATVWDSLLHPLGTQPAAGRVGALAGTGAESVAFEFFDGPARPVRVRWLDRVGDDHRLAILATWDDPDTTDLLPAPVNEIAWRIRFGTVPTAPVLVVPVLGRVAPEPPAVGGELAPGIRIEPAVGGWLVSTPHYRLRLSKSGMITALGRPGRSNAVPPVAEAADLYTDAGFSAKNIRYAAANEVEAAAFFRAMPDGTVRLRFTGRPRGSQRFDLIPTPLQYIVDYALAPDAPGFRLTCAVKPEAGPRGARAFLSWCIAVPGAQRFTFLRNGRPAASGNVGDGARRAFESRDLPTAGLPDVVRLQGEDGHVLFALTDLRSGGARPVGNAFVRGGRFFLAWYDGTPDPGGVGEWSWFTAMIALGGARCDPLGPPTCELRNVPARASRPLLRSPGFERSASGLPVFLERGIVLPGIHAPRVWQAPHIGGRLVTDVVHGGRVAAFVENNTGGYLLWTQELPVGAMPPGSRWRLSAWVRGENIVRGTPAWKVGTVRFTMVVDGKVRYVSCRGLTGTFDWRPAGIEATLPRGVQKVMVQLGLNGSRGRMWIDDVRLSRLPPGPVVPGRADR